MENAEQVGSQPIVVPTTLEQFALTFAFSEDPERLGVGVMRHANTESEYMVRFLPSLYYAENRALEDIPIPW